MEFDVDDMDAWATLAQTDAEEFERRRRAAIERVIAAAPARRQARLRGLQFRVDMERRRCSTPLAACVRINSMMWDSVMDLRNALNTVVHGTPDPRRRPEAQPAKLATVIPFPSKPGANKPG